MNKNTNFILLCLGLASGLLFLPACRENTSTTPLSAESASIESKVDSVLALMNLREKIGQLNQYNGSWDVTGPVPQGENKMKYDQIKNGDVGSMLNVISVEATRKLQELAVNNSRLGIPLIFAYDVIHGYKTMMPIPLGEAASWDLEAIQQSASIAAKEASAAGQHWTFAPMIDISRDARWGRVMEGAGEDPYLGTQIAVARVKGFQGDDLSDPTTVAACAKHFAGYGFSESGRDYNTVDISDHTLHNVVLPPFKACVDAGIATVMNSFNELGGVPATGSVYLQRELLKGEWGFDGFVVSDWGSIREMVDHGVAEDNLDAGRIALLGGSDMDMESQAYVQGLDSLVTNGLVKEAMIDDAVRRILRIKFRLGLFADPYKYCNLEREKANIYSAENRAVAREVARKSIVLLKNEGNILPLKKSTRSIALIGPLADDKDSPLGSWRAHATANSAVSLLEGMQAAVSNSKAIKFAKGAELGTGERSFIRELQINQSDKSGFPKAIATARNADVVVLAIGEEAFQTGEGRSQTSIDLAGVQMDLLKAVYKANKNLVVVLMNGRPLDIRWAADNAPAIVEAWHLGTEAGNAIADVLFGDYNPSGKLPMSFPRSIGQVPIYYNYKNTGRPGPSDLVFWSHYTDEANGPLYPFGYGLSYTDFMYGDIGLSADNIAMDETLKVTVEVRNTGKVIGEEVVQLYIRDLVGSLTRPVKELKGFQKVRINPGGSQTLTFELTEADLAFYTANKKWEAEPGKFKVFVGGSSQDVKEASFSFGAVKK